jgi:hypothetical protein
MTAHDAYLARCKQRALEIFASGDSTAAVASILSDLHQWGRDSIYEADELAIREAEARFYTNSPDEIRDWIESFA